ncbi:hypothetical protein M8494_07455 [Serratia ureilytica]
MMQAARAFLDGGFYQPLQQQVASGGIFWRWRPMQRVIGYRLWGRVLHRRRGRTAGAAAQYGGYGLDVAKVAIRYAISVIRGLVLRSSSHRLPFADGALDAVLRIYAPCKAAELARAVKPGRRGGDGFLPGPRHLYQLKEQVPAGAAACRTGDEQFDGFECERKEALALYDGPAGRTGC